MFSAHESSRPSAETTVKASGKPMHYPGTPVAARHALRQVAGPQENRELFDLILRSLCPQGTGVSKDGNAQQPRLLPSFETLASLALQDEVRDFFGDSRE